MHDLSLQLERGSWLGMIGPNGAGKSSALLAIAGLLRSSGRIEVLGDEVARLDRRELARRVALVPQAPVVPPLATVTDYVLLGRTPHTGVLGRESAADHAAVAEVLERLDLVAFAGRALATLSGGELQRAVLARALAQGAQLLLLDEPTSALDIGHQQDVLELVATQQATSGLTVVSAMHDLTLAGQYADRMLLLRRAAPSPSAPPRRCCARTRSPSTTTPACGSWTTAPASRLCRCEPAQRGGGTGRDDDVGDRRGEQRKVALALRFAGARQAVAMFVDRRSTGRGDGGAHRRGTVRSARPGGGRSRNRSPRRGVRRLARGTSS